MEQSRFLIVHVNDNGLPGVLNTRYGIIAEKTT
jgi:hypothetical protein